MLKEACSGRGDCVRVSDRVLIVNMLLRWDLVNCVENNL